MNTKICYDCKRDLELACFRTNVAKKDGYQGSCIECRKSYNKRHYKNNIEKYKEKAIFHNKQLTIWFKELKSKLKCSICSEDHPSCLDFHHKDPNEKDGNIREILISYGKKRCLQEIEKCTVLCANCHRKLHYDERNVSLDF